MDVYSIASKNPKHRMPDDTVLDALRVMVQNKFRRIPIVDIERPEVEILIGIITASDLMRLLDEYNLGVLNAPLAEVMKQNPYAVPQNTSLGEATMIMTQENFGGLPIVEDPNTYMLTGIITERDIVRAFINSVADATLSEFMNQPVTLRLTKKTSIRKAMQAMYENHTSRVILVNTKNQIKGIVTSSDVLNYAYNQASEIDDFEMAPDIFEHPVENIMIKNVITVEETQSVAEVAKLLVDKKLGGVPVVDENGDLVGTFSERDLLLMIGNFGLFLDE